jgi:hypothetical protein
MKTITKLILGILLFSFNYTNAQVELNAVNVTNNSGSGYKFEEVRYYYYPNLQAYFDTKVGMYLYVENGEWIESEQLDPKTKGYSLKNGQYVMIKDYLGDEPYTMLGEHKKLYPADYSSRPKKPVAKDAEPMIHARSLASND